MTLFVLLAPPVQARTWYVKADQTGDAATIQSAVDSAAAGDEVVLGPGTYSWTNQGTTGYVMVQLKPGVSIRGEESAASTVIDAEFQGICLQGAGLGVSRIENLSITRGCCPAGIYLTGASSPTIENCIFQMNHGNIGGALFCASATIRACQFIENRVTFGNGGAVNCENSQIENCVFKGNGMTGDGNAGGGAVFCRNTSIRNCLFDRNVAGDFASAAGGAVRGDNVTVESSWFVGNGAGSRLTSFGGAAYLTGVSMITGSVFVGNRADHGGAIASPVAGTSIAQCTFVGNYSNALDGIGGIALDDGGTVHNVLLAYTQQGRACSGSTATTWSCSNFFGNALGDNYCGTDAGGNFTADPQFCSSDPATSLNVGIQEDSPCAPGNHPDGDECGLIGAGAVACGSVSVREESWGRIKRLYRD